MNNSKEFLYKSLGISIVITALITVYCVLWGPLSDWGSSFRPARTVTVSASDFKYVKPDIATVSFSVVSEGSDVEQITTENNTKINRVIDYLKNEKNISDDDIKTTRYDLRPVYSQNNKNFEVIGFVPQIVMYSITQTVEVKVRDFKIIPEIMGKLPEFGINKIDNFTFCIENRDNYLNEIQESAFKKAREKAEKIAEQNGVNLGRIVNISVSGPSPYYPYGVGGKSYGIESAGNAQQPSIEPGSEKVSVSVFVEYEIK